jgi:hypothetical protein
VFIPALSHEREKIPQGKFAFNNIFKEIYNGDERYLNKFLIVYLGLG